MSRVICTVCPHHCAIREGESGRCRARICAGGKVSAGNYGKLTAVALDPIEKKPLSWFFPRSRILSVGSYGCNLSCPFCQNYEIAAAGEEQAGAVRTVMPEELLRLAEEAVKYGNIGVAYTYNEPLVGYEYILDTAKLVQRAGMKNVLVTNGMAELWVLEKLLPYIDAMNVDLKGFRPDIYRKLGGDLETVKTFIARAAEKTHVEITSLIVPGMNDAVQDMKRQARWMAEICEDLPLHITRCFPRYKFAEPPTDISVMRELRTVAEQHLHRVRLGNIVEKHRLTGGK